MTDFRVRRTQCTHVSLEGERCLHDSGHRVQHSFFDDPEYMDRVAKGDPIRTKSGRVLTDADTEALADEAERGYDLPPDDYTEEEWLIAIKVLWAAPDERLVADIRSDIEQAIRQARRISPNDESGMPCE